ncbi:DUF2909 family protein [Pseudomonadales bacterium]|nr:DUF2909 family protein [Pseudomonadales bacterium]MDA9285846.1 DUF2909 family protein [Pseudomonadales bacterium]MDA9298029.1 DUF2909 family protein [Pseudomonadales bacterium]MDB4069392.1 DUF2909 family protein [Pseudomonadales bacterium]MDB9917565.1 DUF2909 family protein [Pseudomonadales bacterium]
MIHFNNASGDTYMWIKVIIVLLFVANIVALSGAFYTLLLDQGRGGKRTANLLLVRVALALLLLGVVVYGVWSGDLGISAPWHGDNRTAVR